MHCDILAMAIWPTGLLSAPTWAGAYMNSRMNHLWNRLSASTTPDLSSSMISLSKREAFILGMFDFVPIGSSSATSRDVKPEWYPLQMARMKLSW